MAKTELGTGVRRKRGLVLVVEDDDTLRETLCELLADAGYYTASARDGVEALRFLQHQGSGKLPCLILLDLMMPTMDGWQFRIRQQKDPRFAAIRTAVMTASHSVTTAQVEANYFLRKPIKLEEVLRIADECDTASPANKEAT